MAFKGGTPIQAGLMRADFSPLERAGQMMGQGYASMGQSLASGIGRAADMQKQQKEQQKAQKDAIAAAKKMNEALQMMKPGTSPSRQDMMMSPEQHRSQSKQQDIFNALNSMSASLDDENIPLSQRAQVAQYLNDSTQKVINSGIQTETQRMQAQALRQQIEQNRRMAPVKEAVARAGLEGAKTRNEIDQFKLETMDEAWQQDVAKHAADRKLTNMQAKKLGYEIDQYEKATDDGMWNMPFEKMTAEMKAAFIFEHDLGMAHDDAIKAAFNMEGPSVAETMKEMEGLVVGGHSFKDLWAFTSASDFKAKESKDGTTVELEAGRGPNNKSIKIPKASWDAFNRMKGQYTESINTMFEPAVNVLRKKYPEGERTINGIAGVVSHDGDQILFTDADGNKYYLSE